MASNTQPNTAPYPWDRWCHLPKEERDAEMKEAAKEYASFDNDDVVGHHGTRPPFPYFDSVEVEEIDEPCYTDFIAQRGTQQPVVSADASHCDWFQMHHDDGIMDGYLDVGEDGLPAGGYEFFHADPLIGGDSGQLEDSRRFQSNPLGVSGLAVDSYVHGNDSLSVSGFVAHAGTSVFWDAQGGEYAPSAHAVMHFATGDFSVGYTPNLPGQDNARCATVDEMLSSNVEPGQSTNQVVLA